MITDLRMNGRTGIDLLLEWRDVRCETPFILATAFGDIESAVRAMKLGAADYLTKPIDPTRLLNSIRDVLGKSRPATASAVVPAPGDRRSARSSASPARCGKCSTAFAARPRPTASC